MRARWNSIVLTLIFKVQADCFMDLPLHQRTSTCTSRAVSSAEGIVELSCAEGIVELFSITWPPSGMFRQCLHMLAGKNKKQISRESKISKIRSAQIVWRRVGSIFLLRFWRGRSGRKARLVFYVAARMLNIKSSIENGLLIYSSAPALKASAFPVSELWADMTIIRAGELARIDRQA
jgi:hypothetical protein